MIFYTQGLKYNMIDLNAALGIKQLNKINYMWKKERGCMILIIMN